jgi:hydrogenase nickel incorporation protein HypA/HybF
MFETLLEQARVHKAKCITGVKIQIGALAGVVPELLESAFDSYKIGTIAEDAVLTMVKPPFTIRCRACGVETVRPDFVQACPACASTDLEIIHGMVDGSRKNRDGNGRPAGRRLRTRDDPPQSATPAARSRTSGQEISPVR